MYINTIHYIYIYVYIQGKRISIPTLIDEYPEGGTKKDLMRLPCLLDKAFLDASTGVCMYVCIYVCMYVCRL